MRIIIIIVVIIAGCAGFFLGAITIGIALTHKSSDAVLNLIGNLLTFVGVGAGAYLGFRQLNVGVSQIAETARQAAFDRTMRITSQIESKYRAFDSISWRKALDKFSLVLPIENIQKQSLEEFIAHSHSVKEYKELIELLNLTGEVFHGVEIGFYNQKYIFERGYQFFFDVWRWGWPVIQMQREKDKIMFPNSPPSYMIDLENYLRNNDAIFAPLPEIRNT